MLEDREPTRGKRSQKWGTVDLLTPCIEHHAADSAIGVFMKKFAFSFLLCILTAASAHSADDAASRAMKLFERRHYAEAVVALRADLPSVEQGRQSAAYLTLGMIYLKNAELHRELYRESLSIHLDYLRKIVAAQSKDRSRFVDLYMGEALMETGKITAALTHLEKFAADTSVQQKYRTIAKASIGLGLFLQNDKQKAEETWAGLDTSDPEIKMSLAAMYSKVGLKDKKPVALADEGLADLKKSGSAPTMRDIKNGLTVYATTGLSDKGLDLIKRADLKAFSFRESLGRTKVINFYDPSLLNDLSGLYLQAGIASLEKAAEDAKLRDTANYYLGEAYALSGNIDQSVRATASFISSPQMPQHYRDKAAARQAANQYQKGRQFDAIGTWKDLAMKQPGDPDLLAEILLACDRLKVDCPTIAEKAIASVEAGEGKGFSTLNIAVGRYYLGRKDYAKAVSYIEAGRDKGNKNKIESNDPLMLVSLADAYYRTKKFSEALEIYFEMSKQFPEVRQIQEALQGIYAMEHKSAGDVKIF
jgi:tetratricopeptide (TPR) repeat protein